MDIKIFLIVSSLIFTCCSKTGKDRTLIKPSFTALSIDSLMVYPQNNGFILRFRGTTKEKIDSLLKSSAEGYQGSVIPNPLGLEIYNDTFVLYESCDFFNGNILKCSSIRKIEDLKYLKDYELNDTKFSYIWDSNQNLSFWIGVKGCNIPDIIGCDKLKIASICTIARKRIYFEVNLIDRKIIVIENDQPRQNINPNARNNEQN